MLLKINQRVHQTINNSCPSRYYSLVKENKQPIIDITNGWRIQQDRRGQVLAAGGPGGGAIRGKECPRRRFATLKNVNKAITVLKRGMFKQELAHPRKESLR